MYCNMSVTFRNSRYRNTSMKTSKIVNVHRRNYMSVPWYWPAPHSNYKKMAINMNIVVIL